MCDFILRLDLLIVCFLLINLICVVIIIIEYLYPFQIVTKGYSQHDFVVLGFSLGNVIVVVFVVITYGNLIPIWDIILSCRFYFNAFIDCIVTGIVITFVLVIIIDIVKLFDTVILVLVLVTFVVGNNRYYCPW